MFWGKTIELMRYALKSGFKASHVYCVHHELAVPIDKGTEVNTMIKKRELVTDPKETRIKRCQTPKNKAQPTDRNCTNIRSLK
jgi:tRNA(Phe) wybutosine-synthesizing methylase Tyw3